MGDDDGRDPKDYNRRAKNRENTLPILLLFISFICMNVILMFDSL